MHYPAYTACLRRRIILRCIILHIQHAYDGVSYCGALSCIYTACLRRRIVLRCIILHILHAYDGVSYCGALSCVYTACLRRRIILRRIILHILHAYDGVSYCAALSCIYTACFPSREFLSINKSARLWRCFRSNRQIMLVCRWKCWLPHCMFEFECSFLFMVCNIFPNSFKQRLPLPSMREVVSVGNTHAHKMKI